MSINTPIESETAYYSIIDDILHIVYKDVAIVDLTHVQDNLELRKKIQKGRKMYVLADVRGVWDFTTEAQEFVGKKPVNDITISYAIVTGRSTPILLMAKFFMKFNRPPVPTKLFNTKEKALDWLESCRKLTA